MWKEHNILYCIGLLALLLSALITCSYGSLYEVAFDLHTVSAVHANTRVVTETDATVSDRRRMDLIHHSVQERDGDARVIGIHVAVLTHAKHLNIV